MMEEDVDLKSIEDFIYARNHHFGPGMSTYPENNDEKHRLCLKLEEQGKIKRHYETKNCVVWMPK